MTSGGLDNVVAAETVLSDVDGEGGRLILRGVEIDNLAGHASYEAALSLLWKDVVAPPLDEAEMRAALGRARETAFARFKPLVERIAELSPIEGMRLLLSSIPDAEGDAVFCVAATGVAAAMAAGGKLLPPDPARGHADDVLRMMRGAPATEAEAKAFEAYLVTVLDHGLNASTFAARVVASTLAGLPSALTAALCALKGPLHGGAPGPVLDMLDSVGNPDRATAWVEAALAAGKRLMGFGHRVYRVRDPRADVLKAALARLKGRSDRLALAEAVERAALEALQRRKGGRRLDTNVEFYTALLLDAVGIDRGAFTPVFAAGRVGGWVAHVREQEASGRIIRPQSRYIGPAPRPHAA